MSLQYNIAKKTVKSALIRSKIRAKLKTAVGLVVARGADVRVIDGKEQLVQNESEHAASEQGQEMILKGEVLLLFCHSIPQDCS